jgi:hypothetical protein
MDANTVLHKMRLEEAYRRAQHIARLLAAEALTDGESEASRQNMRRLEAQMADATEAVVWLGSLKSNRRRHATNLTDLHAEWRRVRDRLP